MVEGEASGEPSRAREAMTANPRAVEPPALLALDVSRRFRGGITALDGITLEIPHGRRVALVGPNGAGKTTLLRCWMGFDRPSTGSVRVLGLDPGAKRREVATHVAFVPQQPALYRSLSVRAHLLLAAHARERFDPVVAEAYLDGCKVRSSARVNTLSGGQRAQVMIAIATSMDAEVLLLDEPLASLDPLARRTALDALTAASRSGTSTMVLSSHVIGDVSYVCDWLVLLAHGSIVLSGEIRGVKSRFRVTEAREQPADAIGLVPLPDGQIAWLVPGDAGTGTREASLEEVVMGHLARVAA